MPEPVTAHLLEFVSSPMSEIKRPCTAHLEGVTAIGNVVEVQFRAASNEVLHRLRLEGSQSCGILLEPVKELRIPNAGHLDRFDVAGALVAIGEAGQ